MGMSRSDISYHLELPASSPSFLLILRRKVGAGIESFIDAMSEAGDFLAVGEHVADAFFGVVGVAAIQQQGP